MLKISLRGKRQHVTQSSVNILKFYVADIVLPFFFFFYSGCWFVITGKCFILHDINE